MPDAPPSTGRGSAAAIAGLGVTPQGKVYGSNAVGFTVDAVTGVGHGHGGGLTRSDTTSIVSCRQPP